MDGTNPPGEEGDLPEGLHPVVHSKAPSTPEGAPPFCMGDSWGLSPGGQLDPPDDRRRAANVRLPKAQVLLSPLPFPGFLSATGTIFWGQIWGRRPEAASFLFPPPQPSQTCPHQAPALPATLRGAINVP